jgi:hypothetical protein
MQPLTTGQTIQNQAPVHLFKIIVPPHTPKLALSSTHGTNMHVPRIRISPVEQRRKFIHKVNLIRISQ